LRAFASAAFGGAADGVIIGLGGSGAVSAASHEPVSLNAVGYLILVNLILDTARFVKSNPDPWAFVAPVIAVVPVPPPAKSLSPALTDRVASGPGNGSVGVQNS
jgi:hypothetical protein